MKIIDRYLLKEVGGPFLGSLIVSTVILAAGNIVQTADMIVNKGVELFQVIKIFLLFLPYVLIFTIPISVLSGILLGFGRLSGDNEVTALRTSGVSMRAMILPVIICGVMVSMASVPLNDSILPQSEFAARRSIKEVGLRHPAALLDPGVFVKGFQDYVVFVHRIKDNIMQEIRIYQPRKDGPTRTIVAKRGQIISNGRSKDVKLRLEEGAADEISPDNPNEFYKLSFEKYDMTLDIDKAEAAAAIDKKPREKSIKELRRELKKIGASKKEGIPLRIEIHKKVALAFSNFVFVLLGIPLAITTHRREKFIGWGLAMMLFFLYWGIMLCGMAFAIRGLVPAWVGVWFADALLAAAGLAMLKGLVGR